MSRAPLHLLTCPRCGAKLEVVVRESSDPPVAGHLVIVERPQGWTPKSEWVALAEGIVVAPVEDEFRDPYTYIRQFNATSLDRHGTMWAGITLAEPVVGEPVELLVLEDPVSR